MTPPAAAPPPTSTTPSTTSPDQSGATVEGTNAVAASPTNKGKPEIGAWGFDKAGMDTKVAPGKSFYEYANGSWVKNTPIPADKSNYGMFTVLSDKSDERTKEIPIVFLTARATANDRSRAEKLGALGYVLKPFDPVRLAPLIADVVARCARGESEQLRRERPPELWPPDLES